MYDFSSTIKQWVSTHIMKTPTSHKWTHEVIHHIHARTAIEIDRVREGSLSSANVNNAKYRQRVGGDYITCTVGAEY